MIGGQWKMHSKNPHSRLLADTIGSHEGISCKQKGGRNIKKETIN